MGVRKAWLGLKSHGQMIQWGTGSCLASFPALPAFFLVKFEIEEGYSGEGES